MKDVAMIAALFSLAFCGAAASAQPSAPGASPGAEINSCTVQLTPLDLTSRDGPRQLALRIRSAAEDVCDGKNVLTRSTRGFHDCVRDAMRRAAASLGAPPVTAALAELAGADLAGAAMNNSVAGAPGMLDRRSTKSAWIVP